MARSQGVDASVAPPASHSGGAAGSISRSFAYAPSSAPGFFRGSSVPMNKIGPRGTGAARGVHGGAPGGQMTMRSGGTPRRRSTSPAVKHDTVTTAAARRACAGARPA